MPSTSYLLETQCPACRKSFTSRGLQSHLAQSGAGTACKAIYEHRISAVSTSESTGIPHYAAGPAVPPFADYQFDGIPDEHDRLDSESEDDSDDEHFQPGLDPLEPGDLAKEDEDDVARMIAELELEYEAPRNGAPVNHPSVIDEDKESDDERTEEEEEHQPSTASTTPRLRFQMSQGHGLKPAAVLRYSNKYPDSQAGMPTRKSDPTDTRYQSTVGGENAWASFASKLDWEVARWAKVRGQGSTAFSELLSIDGLYETLGLSYKNSDELNKIIDEKLPSRPQFTRREVTQGGEALEFYSQDVIECICTLWRDPDFVNDLILEPERHYMDPDSTVRMYHDMHTATYGCCYFIK